MNSENKKKEGLVKNTIITTNPKKDDQQKDANFGRKNSLYSEKMLSKALRRHFITIPQSEQDHSNLFETLRNNTRHLKYLLISQEAHEDGGQHYHIMILTNQPITKKSIHKNIMKEEGNIGGSINYQAIESIIKSETYIKKDGKYKEWGLTSKNENLKYKCDKQDTNKDLNEIYNNDKTMEDNLKLIRAKQPAYYTIHSEKIKARLEKKIMEEKPKLRWEPPIYTTKNTTLRPYQQRIWELINKPPKNRRIIWVCGKPNSGKSFMFNYINENYEYGIYSAGSTASLDNAVYGYDEEGAIAWDLNKNFDFENLGNALAGTIEKFSDFGQTLTSRKYQGKKVQVKGHVIVFSNREPLEQLKHRDIIRINTNEGMSEKELLETHNARTKIINDKIVWEVRTQELNETVSRYYYNKEELPVEIRLDVYS